MSDVFNLVNTDYNIQIFTPVGNLSAFNSDAILQTWRKPKNCKIVYIFMCAGGGGGGGGQSGAATNSKIGGGGGSFSQLIKSIVPAAALPDELQIRVGSGGAGGIANGNGSSGNSSRIENLYFINPNPFSSQPYMNTPGGNGGTTAGAGGAAASTSSIQLNPLIHWNIYSSNSTAAGGAGGTGIGSNGASITPTQITSSGAGGGGSTSGSTVLGNGGSIILDGVFSNLSGGTTGGTLNGVNGFSTLPSSLTSVLSQILFTGGSGGAAGNPTGGDGGNGGYCCGGGGGGAGFTTGGRGGRGGDGIVIIVSA